MTKFKTFIAAILLSLFPAVASAQFVLQTIGSVLPRETSGNITTNGQCVTLALWGFNGLGVQVAGTWTGTLQFQVSSNGTDYQTVTLFPTNSTTGATSTTGNGQWGGSGNSSHLQVCATAAMTGTAVVSLSGRMPGSGGGGGAGGSVTQFAEDTPHTTGDVGIQVLAVRNDAGAALATTTGDYIPLTTDNTGALRISGGAAGGTSSNFAAAFPTAGTAIGFTDGTNMIAGRAVDADTGAGTFNVAAFNLVFRTNGTPVEAGTSTNPFNVVFPSTPTVTANAGSGTFQVQSNSANIATQTTVASLDTKFGEVQASPTVNTLLGRLKSVEDELQALQDQTASTYKPVRLVDNAGTGFATLATLSPCSTETWQRTVINISSATTTKIAESTGATKIYICRFMIYTEAANNVTLVEDADADDCASPSGGLAGGSTTGTGWKFSANSGINDPATADGYHYVTSAVSLDVCLISSAATQLSGAMFYVEK